MTIKNILGTHGHRPWGLPNGNWQYYQEWNKVVFLHWQVDLGELRQLVPLDLSIDLYNNKPWVSVVAFTMEKIRLKNLPAFPPISNFDEINIRTYVRYNRKAGVYFLSIEGGTKLSCQIAKSLSGLPYQYSRIKRDNRTYHSSNPIYKDSLELAYEVGRQVREKTGLDLWLTERYALFQDTKAAINEFDIHHIEWPIFEANLKEIQIAYPRFKNLLNGPPNKTHYSNGVQVVAWDKKAYKCLPKPDKRL